MSEQTAEIAIVGAGPIGLELAVALKRAGRSVLQFDAHQIGHTISWFAPQTRFFSSAERIAIAGVPLQTVDQSKPSREEYLTYLRSIVEMFDLDVRVEEPVLRIGREEGGFKISTSRGTYRTAKLVLATGGTARPRMLNIPGENLPHVSHYFLDPYHYFRRRLLIVGGRNSAVEAAIRCYRGGSFVALSYRRPKLDPGIVKYWLSPEINSLIDSGKIEPHFSTVPTAIEHDRVHLRREDGNEYWVAAGAVLLLTGYEADMKLFRQLGVQTQVDTLAPQFDPQTMETNIPGLFVAGTATGGTQSRFTIFIENCHVHVQRIMAALAGAAAPSEPAAAPPEKLES
jgi:bacillithiol disulfide reductase